MNKIIFLFLPFLLTCSSGDTNNPVSPSSTLITQSSNDEMKCEYIYFLNRDGDPDSLVVECPDPKPSMISDSVLKGN